MRDEVWNSPNGCRHACLNSGILVSITEQAGVCDSDRDWNNGDGGANLSVRAVFAGSCSQDTTAFSLSLPLFSFRVWFGLSIDRNESLGFVNLQSDRNNTKPLLREMGDYVVDPHISCYCTNTCCLFLCDLCLPLLGAPLLTSGSLKSGSASPLALLSGRQMANWMRVNVNANARG